MENNNINKKLNENFNGDAIINIAYEVGYNAKSTFNTAFKKFTEMTPSQYIFKNKVVKN